MTPSRRWTFAALAALGALALAQAQELPPGDETGAGDRTANRALIEVVTGAAPGGADGGPSLIRLVTSPTAPPPGPVGWQPMVSDRDEARALVLARRASLRAYAGAPPVMPHSRNFAATKTCLDCHAEGFKLGDRYAPRISHPAFVNCMQCHVEGRNLDLEFAPAPPVNAFDGIEAPGGTVRAGPGAPPLIPHATLMRTNCLSCHGPGGPRGLDVDHPQRSNCVQCHAMAAAMDPTSPFFTGRDPLSPAPNAP